MSADTLIVALHCSWRKHVITRVAMDHWKQLHDEFKKR